MCSSDLQKLPPIELQWFSGFKILPPFSVGDVDLRGEFVEVVQVHFLFDVVELTFYLFTNKRGLTLRFFTDEIFVDLPADNFSVTIATLADDEDRAFVRLVNVGVSALMLAGVHFLFCQS